jgi:FAD/FMN-containing dehydrogenase
VLQSAFDDPSGLQHYWKADFMAGLSDDAIRVYAEYGPQVPNVYSVVHIYPTDGAVQRVGQQETAYSHREANFVHIIAAVSPDPADMPHGIAWVQNYWHALRPYSSGGSYVNFLMDEGQDRVQTTYRENYARLVTLKNKYDPTNLFRINQNIKPTV